eukprot:g4168.t1
MCLYPGFIYLTAVTVDRLGMPEYTQPFLSGLLVVLFDMPFDIMGIKLLWWTWHDTDPNIYERSLWVPLTSYFFHATFASAFVFLVLMCRRLFTNLSGLYSDSDIEKWPFAKKKLAYSQVKGEWLIVITVGLCSMPLGICQFVPLYHFAHDALGISTEICCIALFSVYGIIALHGLQRCRPRDVREKGEREIQRGYMQQGPGSWHVDEISLAVLYHFLHYVVLVFTVDPGKQVSIGLRQPIAFSKVNCTLTQTITYPYSLSMIMDDVSVSKNPYLCANNFDEGYFDFSCLGKGDNKNYGIPNEGDRWYTICGTPYGGDWNANYSQSSASGFANRGSEWEYRWTIVTIAIVGITIYWQALHYPRTIFELVYDIFAKGRLPSYYKVKVQRLDKKIAEERLKKKRKGRTSRGRTDVTQEKTDTVTDGDYTMNPQGNSLAFIDTIADVRVNPDTGNEEYKVVLTDEHCSSKWIRREDLVSDGCGQVYGERYGLYGLHGQGSTRHRIDEFRSKHFAIERLKMYKNDLLHFQNYDWRDKSWNFGRTNSLHFPNHAGNDSDNSVASSSLSGDNINQNHGSKKSTATVRRRQSRRRGKSKGRKK